MFFSENPWDQGNVAYGYKNAEGKFNSFEILVPKSVFKRLAIAEDESNVYASDKHLQNA